MDFDRKWLREEAEIISSIQVEDFLEGLDVGVMIENAEGVLVTCNRCGAELLGHDPGEIIGRTLRDVPWAIEGEDGAPLPVSLLPSERARLTGESQPPMTMAVKNAGKPLRWINVRSFPIVVDGDLMGVLTSFFDLTAEREQFHSLELMTVVNKLLLLATDGETFLLDMCIAFVESGGYALAKIDVAVEDRRKSVRTFCASGADDYSYEGMTTWSEENVNGRGPIGTALRTRATQVINSVASDPSFAPWRERASQFHLGSVISMPFDLGDSRAVFSIYEFHEHAFSDAKVRMLEVMIKDIEFALAHLESVVETRKALAGTISALSRMTASRDPYTAGHQVRVASLGQRIAVQMGLDSAMVTLIQQSGELHDVGKIAIPSEILSRPGSFSKLEFDMVKRHTVIGGDILAKASLPWPIAEVALQHHERLDGSGYPYGLKGDEIILPARIVAVADVVEAMTQHRPYRPALGLDVALGEVSDGAGVRYDATVVEACLAVFESGFVFASDLATPWE